MLRLCGVALWPGRVDHSCVTYLIVPGIGGSGEGHWQTLWERDWGQEAVRIAPDSWDRPELDDWIGAIERAAGVSPVVVVAHSLGCWAAAEWLRVARPADVPALLVAPPDPGGPHFPAAAAPSFLGLTARPVPGRALVVASGNDPYCEVDASRSLARGWNARWHLAGDRGHINASSGIGDWPEGKALVGLGSND